MKWTVWMDHIKTHSKRNGKILASNTMDIPKDFLISAQQITPFQGRLHWCNVHISRICTWYMMHYPSTSYWSHSLTMIAPSPLHFSTPQTCCRSANQPYFFERNNFQLPNATSSHPERNVVPHSILCHSIRSHTARFRVVFLWICNSKEEAKGGGGKKPLRKLQAKTFTIDMFVCDVPCGGYIGAYRASDFGSRRNKYFPCASVRVPHPRKKLATRTWPREWQIVENGKGRVGSVVTTLAICGSWKCNFWWDGVANSGPGSKTISQTTIKRGLLQSIVVVLAGMGPVCLRRWET